MTIPPTPVTCEEFDDAVAELAVESVDEPRRSELVAHAAACARCEAQLDGLAAVADRMLLLATSVEPPPGFESRALAGMGTAASGGRARPSVVRLVLVAAAVAVALAAGVVIGRMGSTADDVRRGTIVAASGARVGVVELSESPRPHVLISVDSPVPGRGLRSCELELPDGRRVVVGTWSYDAMAGGSWAAGIDTSLLQATSMRILSEDGRVVATATVAS